ncbi:MAG: PIG-L deacetylase family protein [Candidatus Hermodarchaeota archaeon]
MIILAIFAHPDDLSFYSGAGTLARWAEEGHTISAICCTRGEVGTLRLNITKEQVAEKRVKELKAANKILGIENTIFLDFPDGGFISGSDLRKKLVYYIRKLKPERIMTLDPWTAYEVHPDHVIVGRMAAEAATFSGFPLLYQDHLNEDIQPHACSDLWFMGFLGRQPNYYVDISSTLEKKVNATLQFEASLEILSKLFAPDIDPLKISEAEIKKLKKYADRLIRSMASVIGKNVDLNAAEAFYVVNILPGHFDNFQQQLLEMLGKPPEPPKIL